ncbi:DUF2157 domain-containing protein [Flavobacterium sp.]|uniref:DUF2157 domain-containing protein n=1 Tax=Flavobacterium sp. TaxID=239 RepID=UPI0039E62B0B
MEPDKEQTAQRLYDENLITDKELADVKAYRSLGIFSLHNELQFLLYASVLLFTAGAGIVIYKNIDTIGHTIILALLLAVCVGCYYCCFKKSPGFSPEEISFDNPVYDYLVLLATILSCIFIGYLQFQYHPFGSHLSVPTYISAFIALASAYYFDNRSALSIGITGLAAAIGITITPQALLENHFFENPALFYYGIALGLLLIVWTEYSERTQIKNHFALIFICFAQHLIGICSLTGMVGDFWFRYAFFLAASTVYFYWKSHRLRSTTVFVFVLLYAYIGFNILLFRAIMLIEAYEIFELITLVSPVYVIGLIFLFIRSIRQFNRKTNDSAE